MDWSVFVHAAKFDLDMAELAFGGIDLERLLMRVCRWTLQSTSRRELSCVHEQEAGKLGELAHGTQITPGVH